MMNLTNSNEWETSRKKKRKQNPRVDCLLIDKDFEEQMEVANALLLLKCGIDYKTAQGRSSDNSPSSSDMVIFRPNRVENHNQLDSVLPLDFKTKIHELCGSSVEGEIEIRFIFQKTLYESDVSVGLNRFLIPLKKIKNEFLTEEEKQRLEPIITGNKREIPKMEIDLIQPCLKVCKINLKKWIMGDSTKEKKKKKKKEASENYVFVTFWNKVVKENKLTTGSIVQLFSFRKEEGQLCFALVNKDSG